MLGSMFGELTWGDVAFNFAVVGLFAFLAWLSVRNGENPKRGP